jgi:hypothetical protein
MRVNTHETTLARRSRDTKHTRRTYALVSTRCGVTLKREQAQRVAGRSAAGLESRAAAVEAPYRRTAGVAKRTAVTLSHATDAHASGTTTAESRAASKQASPQQASPSVAYPARGATLVPPVSQ